MIKETQHVEFKPKFNEDVIETLVAFANADGGQVLVGIDNDGKPDWSIETLEGKNIVIFEVQEYPIKPVATRGRYYNYKRIANSNHLLSVDDIANIKKHLMVEYIITGEPQRTERFDYPLDAIREVVINMVVHRDYRDSSASIIKIFDDRIEFYNPGKLYGGITVESLLSGKYSSKSRNKLIAKAFKEIEMIERYGTGITRIRDICHNYGTKEPLFQEISDGFQVVLYKEKLKSENVQENVQENRVAIILKHIEKDVTIPLQELADKLNVSSKTIQRDLDRLKAKGIIERMGADKGGYWKINHP